MPTQPPILPEDFLSKPAANITTERIDFSKTSLPEYDGLYAVILDNVLSPAECEQLLKGAEASADGKWERAMVNMGNGRQQLITDARNCSRIIWDSPDVATKVWKRIEHLPDVQEILRLKDVPRIFGNGPSKRGEVWGLTRPNERMRFLKYVGGEYFRPHCDGTYETPDRKERSYFTMHLYLNNAGGPSDEELEEMTPAERKKVSKVGIGGGATTFHSVTMKEERDVDVLPKTGRILLFQHRGLLHSGADVTLGTKYTMRTDLMYTLESTTSESRSEMPVRVE